MAVDNHRTIHASADMQVSGRAETVIHMRSADLLYKSGAVSGPAPSNEKGIVEPFAIATITLTIAKRTLFISNSPPLSV
ncbi:hypothetical protein MTX38_22130 [Rhodococcus sp. ARC_M13]|uniref:hypothetical protein n=1 Tax=Rhodococcus sp. ARC_M13 TaxID=2928855 RepID=UPI001FB25C2F|nr:hypothetical protein [Rhodococcus sp. ARC_M13]MCJ0899778.1 hypothetical protein [Rhodococcus sp. ARC_M13]